MCLSPTLLPSPRYTVARPRLRTWFLPKLEAATIAAAPPSRRNGERGSSQRFGSEHCTVLFCSSRCVSGQLSGSHCVVVASGASYSTVFSTSYPLGRGL